MGTGQGGGQIHQQGVTPTGVLKAPELRESLEIRRRRYLYLLSCPAPFPTCRQVAQYQAS
jgi:hypothetical protein